MSDIQLVHLQGAGVKIRGNGLLDVDQESGDSLDSFVLFFSLRNLSQDCSLVVSWGYVI